jgi:hypothetical protein
MKSPAARVYYEVRNESCRLRQAVDLRDAAEIAARENSREAKRRRPGGYRQETGAWEMTYLAQHSVNDCFRAPKVLNSPGGVISSYRKYLLNHSSVRVHASLAAASS